MNSVSRRKSSFYPKQNVYNISDDKLNLDNHLFNEYKIDENEKKLLDFWNSKLEAFEKMNLDDECLIEGETEIKKADFDRNIIPKSEQKNNNSPYKKKAKKSHSKKKSENKVNNKNMIINHKGEIKKVKMESNDLGDVINLSISKELKKNDLVQFFSNQTLLNSIINEMKGK